MEGEECCCPVDLLTPLNAKLLFRVSSNTIDVLAILASESGRQKFENVFYFECVQ